MVEDTPTLGSVESSVLTKQSLATCSYSFNLKNDTFCELFPEIVNEMKSKMEAISQVQAVEVKPKTETSISEKTPKPPEQINADANRSFTSLVIIVGVVVFGLVVNNILKSQ